MNLGKTCLFGGLLSVLLFTTPGHTQAPPDFQAFLNVAPQESPTKIHFDVKMFDPVTRERSLNFSHGNIRVELGGEEALLMAWQLDSRDYTNERWGRYQNRINLSVLEEGDHWLFVGLANADGVPTWKGTRFRLDRTAPKITLEEPGGVTGQPVIQIKGFADEEIASVEYSIENADGRTEQQMGAISRKVPDMETLRFSEVHFQCYDVELAPGRNRIVLSVTDTSGNVATETLQYTFDLSVDREAPEIGFVWPAQMSESARASSTCAVS